MSRTEPKTITVNLHETKFSWDEVVLLGEYLNIKIPFYTQCQFVWKVNEHCERTIQIVFGSEEKTFAFEPHYKENTWEFVEAVIADPKACAIADIKRFIALNLTVLYKEKISNIWQR